MKVREVITKLLVIDPEANIDLQEEAIEKAKRETNKKDERIALELRKNRQSLIK